MKQTTHFSWARMLRVVLAVALIASLLLMCGCKKNNEQPDPAPQQSQITLGDGDGKVEAQDFVDGFSTIYGIMLDSFSGNTADSLSIKTEMTMSITLGDTVLSLLETALDGSGLDSDMSWFESLSLKMLVNMHGGMYQTSAAALLNGTQVISMEVLQNIFSGMTYIAVPELNDKYLGYNAMDMAAFDIDMEEAMELMEQIAEHLPSEEALNALLTRYLEVAIDAIGAPETRTETLSHGGVSQQVTVTTYNISGTDILNVAEAILQEAQDDAELEEICNALSEAVEEIANESIDLYDQLQYMIPDALEEIADERDELAEDGDMDLLSLEVYTAGEEQVGFGLVIRGEYIDVIWDEASGQYIEEYVVTETPIYFYSLTEGQDTAFVLDAAEGTVRVEGTGTVSSGKASGEYTLTAAGYDILFIEVEDMEYTQTVRKGTIRLTPSEELMDRIAGSMGGFLSDLNLEIELDMEGQGGSFAVKVLNGRSLIVGLECSAVTSAGTSVSEPGRYTDINDNNALTSWVMGMDLDTILDNLEDAGVPDQWLDLLESLIAQSGL